MVREIQEIAMPAGHTAIKIPFWPEWRMGFHYNLAACESFSGCGHIHHDEEGRGMNTIPLFVFFGPGVYRTGLERDIEIVAR